MVNDLNNYQNISVKMTKNFHREDMYFELLWDIIDSLMWLQSYHHSDENKSSIHALYEGYRNHLKEFIKHERKNTNT